MTNFVSRNFWNVPSLIDDIDDLVAPQTDVSNAISISEDDKNIYIQVAVPGVDPDDVEVTFDRGLLWIRGEVREEEQDKKRKYHRRATRAFSYRITVPENVDPNAKLEAECSNGMVTVTFPKATAEAPQKITVRRGKTNNGKSGKDERREEKAKN